MAPSRFRHVLAISSIFSHQAVVPLKQNHYTTIPLLVYGKHATPLRTIHLLEPLHLMLVFQKLPGTTRSSSKGIIDDGLVQSMPCAEVLMVRLQSWSS